MQLDVKMHAGGWIQQVTARVGAMICWIQPPVSPKQVVEFTCVSISEVDQSISKPRVHHSLRTQQVGYANFGSASSVFVSVFVLVLVCNKWSVPET